MDRQIVYAGSIPLETDLLHIQRNVEAAIGTLSRVVLGEGSLVEGLSVSSAAGGYGVLVAPGSLMGRMAADGAAFGALPADATPVMRTGILSDAVVLSLGPPPAANQVACWLVQASIAELDGAPIALPYWNAANPSVSWAGPGNSGAAQNTQRQLRVQLAIKMVVGASTATVVPPEPDAGWTGLVSVATFVGKPVIDAADIRTYDAVPRLRYTLPAMPPGPTQMETYTADLAWRVPPLVRWVRVRLTGAGGGGGGGDVTYSGGGGGAGGYAEAVVPVVPGQVIAIAVGQGGRSGGPGAAGLDGGGTVFGQGMVAASGGQGGGANSPDSHGGAPGAGSAGRLVLPGGYGGDGARLALIPGGNGGASAFGGGGRGANEGGLPTLGQAPGSGGGGGYGASALGGQGANGIVVIEY